MRLGWRAMSLVLPSAILFGWLFLSAWTVARLTWWVDDRAWRLVTQLMACAALLPLPLADELVGRVQFDHLCGKESLVDLHVPEARQQSVWPVGLRAEPVSGLALPVTRQPWWLVDESRLVLASYHRLEASGGWLARWVSGRLDAPPLTFPPRCEPAHLEAWLQARGLHLAPSDSISPPAGGPPHPWLPSNGPGPAPSAPASSA